jgi:N-acetylmuramoyl-L-alanine amidase
MKINVHAGHNPDGKIACGAVGLIKESTEARKVKKEVIRLLRKKGHKVYDCTCQNGTSQTDVLKRIVTKCNQHKVDLDISIHFNSGAADKKGNGKTTGTEVYVYSTKSAAYPVAERIDKAIAALGFRDRGVKVRTNLYVLHRTNSPAMLIECCFVDDKDDVKLYDAKKMAAGIVSGILGKN